MCPRMLPLALALALLAGPIPATADEVPETRDEPLVPSLDPGTEDVPAPTRRPGEGGTLLHGSLNLSLEDALKMGLENNLDVEVERYAPIIAEYDEEDAWGAYDPEAFAEFGYTDARSPSASTLQAGVGATPLNEITFVTERTTDGNAGFRGLLPFLGTEYNLQYDATRRTSLNAAFESLSPDYRSVASFTLTQPLLRDLVWNQPWTQVKTSRILLDSSREDFRRAVMDTVTSIEDAYWQLIADQDARRVAEKSLETAKALLDQTQTQYEVGVVSKVEVTEAEAGLSQREVNLIRARNAYRNQQDVLIDSVLGRGLRSDSTMEIIPTDQPEEYVEYEIDVPTAVEQAFEYRPELVSAQKEIERQEVQLQFAKNQRLPNLDLQGGYTFQGLSGSASGNNFGFPGSPPPPTNNVGNYNDTFDDFFEDNKGRTWSGRALFSIPLPNTSARAAVSRTELELRRAGSQKKRLEQSIIVEVRRTARNLQDSQEAIDAARDAERAAQEQLRAERIRLEYGESTPFDVLQREEDLVDRENELIDAFRSYRTSVTALDRAQGTTLRNRNIRIDTVGALR